MPEILTVDEVAECLRCSTNTIYRMLKSGVMRSFKVGSDHRFTKAYIEGWIKEREGENR